MLRRAHWKYWMMMICMVFMTSLLWSEKESAMTIIATAHEGKKEVQDERVLTKELRLQQLQLEKLAEDIGLDDLDKDATLEEKLDLIVNDERLSQSITGISIHNASTGQQIYNHYAEILLRPASNMKIVTAVAALETLGPDYTYTTEVLTDGKHKDKTLTGDVYLKGAGDPTLLVEDFTQFAKDLKDEDIDHIKGKIVGDDLRYDDMYVAGDMPWADEQYYYGAPISALTVSPTDDYNTATVSIEAVPGKSIGESAEIVVFPNNDVMTIENHTKTVAHDKEQTITIDRVVGSNTIVIEGEIPEQSQGVKKWRTVANPTEYAVNLFTRALEEEGITISEEEDPIIAETPTDATVLVSKESKPLAELIIPFMKTSNNGFGELFVKEMGKVVGDEGSWSEGLDVVSEVASDYGVEEHTMLIRDGSGISDNTLISAEQFATILYEIQEADWYEDFELSLPVAGIDEKGVGGSLQDRMLDEATIGNVQAKTGGLTGVSSLSGYVTTADGEELIFSLIMNNFLEGSMHQFQDLIVTVLATSGP